MSLTKKILTWRERCQIHPEHQGGAIVTSRMIERRMQEEIDELRAEWEKACAKMSGHEPEEDPCRVVLERMVADKQMNAATMRQLAQATLDGVSLADWGVPDEPEQKSDHLSCGCALDRDTGVLLLCPKHADKPETPIYISLPNGVYCMHDGYAGLTENCPVHGSSQNRGDERG